MSDVKFVYTVSSVKDMIGQLEDSINSLLAFVGADQIIVYFTPPRNEKDIKKIESLGVEVRKKDHLADKFSMNDFEKKSYYCDKAWFTDVESENVVFLDCDTLIKENITKELEGSFKFKARSDTVGVDDQEAWEKLFYGFGIKNVFPEVNTGFIIFKDGLHRDIKEDYLDFLQEDLQKPEFGATENTDQYALALAIGKSGLEYESEYYEEMSKRVHVFRWLGENPDNPVVVHRADNKRKGVLEKILGSLHYRTTINFKPIYKKIANLIR